MAMKPSKILLVAFLVIALVLATSTVYADEETQDVKPDQYSGYGHWGGGYPGGRWGGGGYPGGRWGGGGYPGGRWGGGYPGGRWGGGGYPGGGYPRRFCCHSNGYYCLRWCYGN